MCATRFHPGTVIRLPRLLGNRREARKGGVENQARLAIVTPLGHRLGLVVVSYLARLRVFDNPGACSKSISPWGFVKIPGAIFFLVT